MSPSATNGASVSGSKSLKPNVGVYTNPNHDLWVAESGPTAESVAAGTDLKEGEVTINVRTTGICG